jgi:intracellular sulfur oxidation DsrE/DsrF family protein
MKKILFGLFALCFLCVTDSYAENGGDGFWTTPTIQGYGKMHFVPEAKYKPDPSRFYKIVFLMTHAPASPNQVDSGLDHVARAINLYVASGVPVDHLKIVAIAYGAAAQLALNDAAYHEKFGVDNPNLSLIESLREHGVDVAVCAQAVAQHGYKYEWIDKRVTLALSGLTTVTTLESDGYVLMPL